MCTTMILATIPTPAGRMFCSYGARCVYDYEKKFSTYTPFRVGALNKKASRIFLAGEVLVFAVHKLVTAANEKRRLALQHLLRRHWPRYPGSFSCMAS